MKNSTDFVSKLTFTLSLIFASIPAVHAEVAITLGHYQGAYDYNPNSNQESKCRLDLTKNSQGKLVATVSRDRAFSTLKFDQLKILSYDSKTPESISEYDQSYALNIHFYPANQKNGKRSIPTDFEVRRYDIFQELWIPSYTCTGLSL